MSDISIPGGRIRSFVERVEHLDTELQLRKQDKGERDERDTLLDMYMRAMETAAPELAAKAA